MNVREMAQFRGRTARWLPLLLVLLPLATALSETPAWCEGRRAGAWPSRQWQRAKPSDVGMDEAMLSKARHYALAAGGAGFITRYGKLVMSWGDPRQRYDLKSTTKSIGVSALGLAIGDGKIRLSDPAGKYHPTFAHPPTGHPHARWFRAVTIRQLATQTAGFDKPGGCTKLLFPPGTQWCYSDSGPNWLAECVTLAYRQDVKDLLFDRVFRPLGITADDLTWRKNQYRAATIDGIPRREFGSGISANVDAMARIGYLYLRHGRWRGRQILPADFVDRACRPLPQVVGLPEYAAIYDNASDHYGLLWWNNADGSLAGVSRNTYWSWGLYDSLIVVFPDSGIVATRAGPPPGWRRKKGAHHYDVLAPFLEPIAASVTRSAAARSTTGNRHVGFHRVAATVRPADVRAPYPPSPVIVGIRWAGKETIVRQARGSDNWPLTWADDDLLYTAYGDGNGFVPRTPKKLSLGLARIAGGPTDFRGMNIRAASMEQFGDGAKGKKASGILMVDGVLYMWVRNAGNSQLAWSTDHGAKWTWSDWRFTTSFGCPTFLNFGRNYAGARDEFVYVYSHDSASAYTAADHMVLARVRRDRLRRRGAYEFLQTYDVDEQPHWTRDIHRRGSVFSHRGKCYRGGVSYDPALQRYLWCQILPPPRTTRGSRPAGGFGIYDAPEPWGPWTTVFFTRHWDVDPGESGRFPPKWMSRDGRRIYFVFSGKDSFSVRQAVLRISQGE